MLSLNTSSEYPTLFLPSILSLNTRTATPFCCSRRADLVAEAPWGQGTVGDDGNVPGSLPAH